MTDPLIRTKLGLPFTRADIVSRPRLQDRIRRGLAGPLTLITAPAGFGKTTLAASCAVGNDTPIAWLSLDKDDNRDGRFLKYLVAALREIDDSIGKSAEALLTGSQQPQSEAVLTSLINDLDATDREMVLVLDDYQLIKTQPVHDAVTFLLDHMPNSFHLIVATRSDPPLPLARLRARGQTVELRAADLRFTAAEAAGFLNQVMGLHLDEESVAALEARTEGWIAGLQMAALSLRDRADARAFIESFSGSNRHILDYLLEEILERQSPEIQRFLLNTSILERLTAPLCEALLTNRERAGIDADPPDKPIATSAANDSEKVLDYLERENLFVVPLDDERVWYRYHHLFADLLKARLQQKNRDLIPNLHIRAAAWLEANGYITDAIQHLLAAHEVDRAADLIEMHGSACWTASDPSVVQMADNLPPEMLIKRTKIGLYQAWLHINQGSIDKAYPLLLKMADHLAGLDSDSDQYWMGIFIQLALAFLTPPKTSPGEDNPLPDSAVFDCIPDDEFVLRDAADILYGMALGRRGEIDRAVEFTNQAIQRDKGGHGSGKILTLIPFLATMYLFQGRLHAAASLCREFLNVIREKGNRITSAGNLEVVLGNVLLEWNHLEESEAYIREGLKANEPWGNIMTEAFGLLSLAQVQKARGDFPGAIQTVDKFEIKLKAPSRPIEFREPYLTLRVIVQLAAGDLQAAVLWADRVMWSDDFLHHREYYQLTLARIRLAQGNYSEVEKLLAKVPPYQGIGSRIVSQLEPDLLRAAALAGQHLIPEALSLIHSCLATAEPEGFIRVFLDGGEPVRELLSLYMKSAGFNHKQYAQKILKAFLPPQGPVPPGHGNAGWIEPLSAREMEVLVLMAEGRTNPEIARQLVVAPGTIKAHAASIYRKLEAANRTEAVAHARQLGLLA